MSEVQANAAGPAQPLAPWWFRLAGRVLRPLIKLQRDPAEPARLLQPQVPVCYVIERHGLSDAVILARACREAGLPPPMAPLQAGSAQRRYSVFSMARVEGWLRGRHRRRASDVVLRELFAGLATAADADVQVVPVSIYVGRAPARDSGWLRALFSENWVVVGHFRRLLAILLNGRHTLVHFAEPVSLRGMLAEAEAEDARGERLARKLSRVLRVHFRRIRAMVIGPDLSHRRTVVDQVLDAEPVRQAIAASAERNKLSAAKAHKRARKMVLEIAADYSHPVVRSSAFLLTGFWNRIYDGVSMRHFEAARAAAPGHEIIYVPCHRSHADYLLMSYQLHVSGVAIPHIAAGINLNLPVLGSYLRRGGAFFLRRSFKGSALYSTIFREYLAQLIDRGVPIEYFIEGGRSRSGRLLQPKAGMLSMTVRAFLRAPRRPVLFQPVYIGYERLMEGRSYISELSGNAKEKESWWGLIRAARNIMKQHYGHVSLNFGEPILLTDALDASGVDWRNQVLEEDARPAWMAEVVDDLAERIQVNINAAADVNAINLLALVVLAMPKHAIAEADLRQQLELVRGLLRDVPYSARVTVTEARAEDIIAHGERMGWLTRVPHGGGDVLRAADDKGILLSYFRNNVLHLVACIGWVACCFANNERMSRASLLRLGRLIHPYIRGELFLQADAKAFDAQLRATVDAFVQRGLLQSGAAGRRLARPVDEVAAFRLHLLAHPMQQAFERYYMAISALHAAGQGAITAGELEHICTAVAQRLSLLHEMNAPEFFDKALFRGFIRRLREQKLVWPQEDGKLAFSPALADLLEDARLVLPHAVRHSIMRILPGVAAGRDADVPPGGS